MSRAAPPSPEERIDRLRLARTEGVGPVAHKELMARYGSATKVLDALPGLARRAERVRPLTTPTLAQAEAEIDAGEALGARLIVLGEPAYPPLLAALDPPPPLIWTRGDIELLAKPAVAVVGARVASAAGQRFARELAAGLGQAGYVVVSGMARGVDAAAHEGSIATGTVAVLGGGIDDLYPPEHGGLRDAIAARGCLVSESPVGWKAQARDFPRRNRIISGLSLGVAVVEAELKSGSLITARLAAEQGREVFAVPGSPLDPRSKGPNDLIRQGATLIEGVEDVLRELRDLPLGFFEAGDGFDPELDQDAVDVAAGRIRARVEALLSPTPVPRDELVRALAFPAPGVFAALVELSLAGKAQLLPGGMVCRGEGED